VVSGQKKTLKKVDSRAGALLPPCSFAKDKSRERSGQ